MSASSTNISRSLAQLYGDYFKGYSWTVFGCGTFIYTISSQHAEAMLKTYMRRLGKEVRGKVSYIAVLEYRYSGCGLSPIRKHFHFLAACPSQWTNIFPSLASTLWEKMAGLCKIEPYDPLMSGAYYVAKLAAHQQFDWFAGNLELLVHTGEPELLAKDEMNLVHSIAPAKLAQTLATHPASSDGFPSTAPKPPVPTQCGPTAPAMLWLWRKCVKAYHNVDAPKKVGPEVWGRLSLLRYQLGPATAGVIQYSVENWQEFVELVSSQVAYGHGPALPSISYLVKHRKSAFAMTYEAAKSKGAREWAMVLTAYKHGMRASEVCNLRLGDIDLKNGSIVVDRLKGSLRTIQAITEHRGEPLLNEQRALRQWLSHRGADGSDFLFTSQKGGRLDRSQFFRLFQAAAHNAGLSPEKRHPHALKHSLASHLIAANVNLALVKQQLGHKSINSTMRYIATSDRQAALATASALMAIF